MATSSPKSACLASTTTPMPPLPSTRSTVYFPSITSPTAGGSKESLETGTDVLGDGVDDDTPRAYRTGASSEPRPFHVRDRFRSSGAARLRDVDGTSPSRGVPRDARPRCGGRRG